MVKFHSFSDWDYFTKGIVILGSQTLSTCKLYMNLAVILEISTWLGNKGIAPKRMEMVHF